MKLLALQRKMAAAVMAPLTPSERMRPKSARGQSMRPSLGSPSPAINRSSVDLPQPDGPSSDRNSPSATVRSMPCNAWVPLA